MRKWLRAQIFAFDIFLFIGVGGFPHLLVRMALSGLCTDNHSFPVMVSETVQCSILVQDTIYQFEHGKWPT